MINMLKFSIDGLDGKVEPLLLKFHKRGIILNTLDIMKIIIFPYYS